MPNSLIAFVKGTRWGGSSVRGAVGSGTFFNVKVCLVILVMEASNDFFCHPVGRPSHYGGFATPLRRLYDLLEKCAWS